jgi:hypothetical protein
MRIEIYPDLQAGGNPTSVADRSSLHPIVSSRFWILVSGGLKKCAVDQGAQ